MPFAGRVAPAPLPASIHLTRYEIPELKLMTSARYLSSVFEGLAVGPVAGKLNQEEYKAALAVGNLTWAIEKCIYKPDGQNGYPPIYPSLRALVEKVIRHARRVTGPEVKYRGDRTVYWRKHRESLPLYQRFVRMLRREVIRAIRLEVLLFRYTTGETFRPDRKSLKGRKWDLASFVNIAFYAVTRELGTFEFPLLPLNAMPRTSDEMEPCFWDPRGLQIKRDTQGGWMVECSTEISSGESSAGEKDWESMSEEEYDESVSGEGNVGSANENGNEDLTCDEEDEAVSDEGDDEEDDECVTEEDEEREEDESMGEEEGETEPEKEVAELQKWAIRDKNVEDLSFDEDEM